MRSSKIVYYLVALVFLSSLVCGLNAKQFPKNPQGHNCFDLAEPWVTDKCLYLSVMGGADLSYCDEMTTDYFDVTSCKRNSSLMLNSFWIGQTLLLLAVIVGVYVIHRVLIKKKVTPIKRGFAYGFIYCLLLLEINPLILLLDFRVPPYGTFNMIVGLLTPYAVPLAVVGSIFTQVVVVPILKVTGIASIQHIWRHPLAYGSLGYKNIQDTKILIQMLTFIVFGGLLQKVYQPLKQRRRAIRLLAVIMFIILGQILNAVLLFSILALALAA